MLRWMRAHPLRLAAAQPCWLVFAPGKSVGCPRSISGLVARRPRPSGSKRSKPTAGLALVTTPQRGIQLGWLLGPPPARGTKAYYQRYAFCLGGLLIAILASCWYEEMLQWQIWDAEGDYRPFIQILDREEVEIQKALKAAKIQLVCSAESSPRPPSS
ncbi:hypothetical protein TCAL_14768 [Tigriopus californicus]|uniref:Uncharacterized protein n=1 Tax=Tigriopus californicus TaxID=6832 RepID=A0A553PGG4_TIGCA|nr:hypothetical protein TCAL_14768 [Tigriopus californicus]